MASRSGPGSDEKYPWTLHKTNLSVPWRMHMVRTTRLKHECLYIQTTYRLNEWYYATNTTPSKCAGRLTYWLTLTANWRSWTCQWTAVLVVLLLLSYQHYLHINHSRISPSADKWHEKVWALGKGSRCSIRDKLDSLLVWGLQTCSDSPKEPSIPKARQECSNTPKQTGLSSGRIRGHCDKFFVSIYDLWLTGSHTK